ncbi:MAG: KilA-N domain-containing protein [Clostridia bacterium]|nr:KilA-N domain-containing protein [Clostridia bacterium]
MSKELIKTRIKVKDNLVSVIRIGNVDYISLTDLARYKNPIEPKDVIKNWLRAKTNIEFLALWEQMHNPNLKGVEIDTFKSEAGTHYFTMSPQRWIKETNAIGIISKSGNNGGTYAHPDIAFEFASWISPEFNLYLITEFERLKQNESYQNKIDWSVRRELAKTNYRIHTDSIKENIIPTLTEKQKLYVYANEADILNVALFGMTAKEWKDKNPTLDGNMRDYANILQLVILSNLENLNSEMIAEGIDQKIRLEKLNIIAKKQYNILQNSNGIKKIEMLYDKKVLKD